jgi:hypothetical protein
LQNSFAHNYSIVERLAQFGIKSKDEAIATVELLDSLCSGNPAPEIDRSVEKANELRRRAIYTKVQAQERLRVRKEMGNLKSRITQLGNLLKNNGGK